MITAEAEPFARSGGLGEMVSALASGFARHRTQVSVFLPYYREVADRGYDPRPLRKAVTLLHGGGERSAILHHLEVRGVDYYFLAEEEYFWREGLYGTSGGEYPDAPFRFSFLTRAALAALPVLGIAPDVIQAHDWHAALTPYYLSRLARGSVHHPAVVLTIHNLAYQGLFPPGILPDLGLPAGAFSPQGVEFYGMVDFLKGGIMAADAITTVSPTYAREVLTPARGEGLHQVLAARPGRLFGILNGIDEGWDPSRDRLLARTFSPRDARGKAECKRALQTEMGLDSAPAAPLFAFVGRMVEQKGVDLITAALPRLVEEGAQVVLLGSGDGRYEEMVRREVAQYPGKAAARVGFDEHLSHRIYGGSDFFLMPSRYEPCGLGQLIAMRYGSLPVARRTGGLADTVHDLTGDPVHGNGFLFEEPFSSALLEAARRAVAFYRSPAMAVAVTRVMAEEHGWKGSLAAYHHLFTELAKGKLPAHSAGWTDDKSGGTA